MASTVNSSKIENLVRTAYRKIHRNVVVILPLAVSALYAANGLSWKDALPAAAGVILRQFFTSPTVEVEAKQHAAYQTGVGVGRTAAKLSKP